TIKRVSEIKGEILIVFGSKDPHTPESDRQTMIQTLEQTGVTHKIFLYEAEHTFMRDDGYRYDSVATTKAWSEITPFFNSVFKNNGNK
ncbi:MAG: dienelactone hydrolase family protein, partial [Trichodesmium sp. St5_bin8]|nr:dienelactone hydrolase family protein [Trichodesmium sp. St5_bin8]